MRARRRAHEHEVGDVRARYQEYEPNRAGEDEERRPDVPDDDVLQRDDRRRGTLGAAVAIGAVLVVGEDPQLRECRGERRILGQSANHRAETEVAALGRNHDRDPDHGVLRKLESFGHHAHDRLPVAFDRDGSADDGRIAAEAVAPERVADDGDVTGTGRVVTRPEHAAEARIDPERTEEGRADARRLKSHRLTGAEQRRRVRVVTGRRRKCLR